jgi:hypothetical protein
MTNRRSSQHRLMIDPGVQGTLILRVVLYWIICLVGVTLMLFCWRMIVNGPQPLAVRWEGIWLDFGPALVASVVLLPLVVFDVLRVSNRFSGPLFRLRRAMRALARGEHIAPISFREGDFWIEIAHEFNAIAARLQPPAGLPEHEETPEEQHV